MDEIIKKIKQKKELSDLPDSFVKKFVIGLGNVFRLSEKQGIKRARAGLRRVYGMFRQGNTIEKNASTRTRLKNYPEIYRKIFTLTGEPKSILDLGCGLNPLSLSYSGLEFGKIKYYGFELSGDYCGIVNNYFKENKIKGRCFQIDLTERENWKKLPKSDICFIFRVLESLEAVERNISMELIRFLISRCRHVIVSFSTKGLGGRVEIKKRQRVWFIRYLEQLGLKFDRFECGDEIFYIVHGLEKQAGKIVRRMS